MSAIKRLMEEISEATGKDVDRITQADMDKYFEYLSNRKSLLEKTEK